MDDKWLSILSLSAWLVLALGGLAAYRLSWKKGIVLALVWAAIFTAVVGLISAVKG